MNRQTKAAQFEDAAVTHASGVRIDADTTSPGGDIWMMATQAAVIGIGIVVGIAALYMARSIVMPVVAALIVGITMRPVQKFAEGFRIPPLLTAAMLVVCFSALLYAIVMITVGPIQNWIEQTPQLGDAIKQKLRWFDRPLDALRDLQHALGVAPAEGKKTTIEADLASLLQGAIAVATPAITEFLIFLGTLLFFLLGTERLRRQLITFFETREARLRVMRIWNDIEQNLITYVATVTFINAGLGLTTAAMLYVVGFPAPMTFGALTFVLNFIPYIGPAVMLATLFGVGLIALPTFGAALIAPLLFLTITTIEGHFITPGIVGHRLTLGPFLVFLALVFWTWLWGAFGTFLATPLLIVGLVLLGHLAPKDEVALPK